MSVQYPQTMEEWDAYFARYSGKQLFSKAKSMNTIKFVKTLKDEDYSMGDIEQIFTFIARRLISADFTLPDGIIDMYELVEDDPEAMPGNFPESDEDYDDSGEPDDVDAFITAMDEETGTTDADVPV
jgi:hypothetical protein